MKEILSEGNVVYKLNALKINNFLDMSEEEEYGYR